MNSEISIDKAKEFIQVYIDKDLSNASKETLIKELEDLQKNYSVDDCLEVQIGKAYITGEIIKLLRDKYKYTINEEQLLFDDLLK